ncbi:putative phage tail component-like protein [Croceifilum oryzae]|uniref:Phage tail component-like protein n=1 Tax=Croceifilum oryzae TaxID=1553429 RepID=A0AAJ1TL20_9BACL|nr:distal tail protein Dit [Croceifilum oryzae]MDQ0418457.1 putative phage tail component-like protein [Croceifilum oryzae]
MAIRFNNQDLPPFVVVKDLHLPILTGVKQTTSKVKGRAGSWDFGNELEDRVISADITIEADSLSDLLQKVRDFGEWLYYTEAKPLQLVGDPDVYYLAKLTGDTDLNLLLSIGQCRISFICTDPYAYGKKKEVLFQSGPVEVENQGGVDTSPLIEMEFTAPTTEFAIINKTQSLYFGQPVHMDSRDENVPTQRLVIDDDGSSIAKWTSGIAMDGGIVTGSFLSDGEQIKVADYGKGEDWHGPAKIKVFPQPLQDFSVEARVGFTALVMEGHEGRVGRIEIYLLDVNNNRIGKMALCNFTTAMSKPTMEARVGTLDDGHYFVNQDLEGLFLSRFSGRISISRIGQMWNFKIARGGFITSQVWSNQYFDAESLYQTQVAGIQIHVGARGENDPYSSAYFDLVRVFEENVIQEETPNVFETGDQLLIDCASGGILKNGFPFYSSLKPSSQFLRLEKGKNVITCSPSIVQNGKVRFQERWL